MSDLVLFSLMQSLRPFMRDTPVVLFLAALFSLFLGGACSSPTVLQTQSLSQTPSVDGNISEWGGTLTPVGERSVTMGTTRSDGLLYLAVVISDQSLIRSVAANGLVVWVDPSGNQQHTYGVQYPIALPAQRAAQKTTEESSGTARASLGQLFPSDLAIIRDDTVRHRMPSRFSTILEAGSPDRAALVSALEAQATLNTGSLIYEISIPVKPSTASSSADDWKHGLRTSLGQSLSVGLETPDPSEDSELLNRAPGIPSVTGTGGRSRSPRGRQRGQRGRRAPSSASPSLPTLNLWMRVVSSSSS